MKNLNTIITTITIIGLIIVILSIGSYHYFNPNEIEKIVEVCPETAMLNAEYLGLYENLQKCFSNIE